MELPDGKHGLHFRKMRKKEAVKLCSQAVTKTRPDLQEPQETWSCLSCSKPPR